MTVTPKLGRLRILVVEDHPFQRELLEQSLRSLGVETIAVASNGAEALRLLRGAPLPFDLVLTDMIMPEIDGIEFIPLFGKTAPGVPLVLCSMQPWALDVGRHIAEAAGVPLLAALRKPVTPEILVSVFQKLLAHGSAPRVP